MLSCVYPCVKFKIIKNFILTNKHSLQVLSTFTLFEVPSFNFAPFMLVRSLILHSITELP